MGRQQTVSVPDVDVVASTEIPESVRVRAKEKLAGLAQYTREPVLHLKVRITVSHDPAVDRPVLAQGNVDLNGRMLRVQVTAVTPYEAVTQLEARMRRRLDRMARHWEARRGRMPEPAPHEWRHISEPMHRPDYYPRPESNRQVVRHKTFGPARSTPDEAVFDMEMLDYDFYLFTDTETGIDSLVYRAGPMCYRLSQVRPDPARQWDTVVPLAVDNQRPPRLSVAEARVRLDVTGLPFVFFADAAKGRGRVLYRRYDGNYGLIQPVA